MRPLYFDYNATTPVHEDVVQAMLPFFTQKFGNPGCGHMYGMQARKAMEIAREKVAGLINADPGQIFFTSCATESNNQVLSGVLQPHEELIVSAVEHPSIIKPAHELSRTGVTVRTVSVDSDGLVDPDQLLEKLSDKTKLVSIMLANNETGTIQPVADITSRTQPVGILVHTDAAQAVGKIPVDVKDLKVDFLSIAGHKMYAPKGIGALYVRDPGTLKPLLYGGGQEKGLRSGTENIAYIAGLGQAAELAGRDTESEVRRQKLLGKKFIQGLSRIDRDFVLHAQNAPRLPGTMSIGFAGCRAGDILSGMIACNLAASAGAACHGDNLSMSPVLEAMSADPYFGLGTIRFSWGRMTAEKDIEELCSRLEFVFHDFLNRPG